MGLMVRRVEITPWGKVVGLAESYALRTVADDP